MKDCGTVFSSTGFADAAFLKIIPHITSKSNKI
jgi:hypothetical protein